MMQFGNVNSINLDDPDYFEILGGLWKGKKPPFTKAGVIRNTNFTASGEVDYSDVAWLDVEIKQLVKRKLKYGDIIIERSGGGPKQPVGRVVQFKRLDGVFSFSNFTTTVRVKKFDELEPLFAFYVLLYLYLSGRTDDIQRRTTGLRNLDFKAYKERAIFPLITTAEQRRIVYILATVQTAIEQQERLIKLTRELKSTLMHKLFTEGLRGAKQKMTEIGLVPESWDVVPLQKVSREGFQNGAFIKNPGKGKGILFANVVDMYGDVHLNCGNLERIDVEISKIKQYLLQENDILVVRSSLKREGIGQNSVVKNLAEPIFFDCHLIRIKPDTKLIVPEFLSYFWRSNKGKQNLIQRSKTTTMTTINQATLASAVMPLPSYEEQSEIAKILLTIDAKIQTHRRKQEKLEELFRTLLHQLMTCQTRVSEIDLPTFPGGENGNKRN